MNRIYTDISHFRAPYKNWPYLGIGADAAADATPWYKNPLYLGGALAVVAGAYFLLAKPTRKAMSNKRRARMNGRGNYFVVDAPGYYGDGTIVRSSHKTLEAAKKAAKKWGHAVVRKGALIRGQMLWRSAESTYPIASRSANSNTRRARMNSDRKMPNKLLAPLMWSSIKNQKQKLKDLEGEKLRKYAESQSYQAMKLGKHIPASSFIELSNFLKKHR